MISAVVVVSASPAERHNMDFHNVYSSPKVINGQIKEIDTGGGGVGVRGAGGACRMHWSGENVCGILV
jgi:hypothetical protein